MKEVAELKKMSIKTLGCDPKPARKLPKGETLKLCIIYGIAVEAKSFEDRVGTLHTALLGDFEGTNTTNGETFTSQKLFLPKALQEGIESKLRTSNQAVKFAYEIQAIESEASQVGYEYRCIPLMPPSANDQLDEIRAAVNNRNQPKQVDEPTAPAPVADRAAGKRK